MDDANTPKAKRKVGKMPNLANLQVVYSDKTPTVYEVDHAKREVERLVMRALAKSAKVDKYTETVDS